LTSTLLIGVLIACGLGLSASTPALADSCTDGAGADFNGDGFCDIAVADPESSVDGVAEAGAVHVIYGGGQGEVKLTQAMAGVPGSPESHDQFGYSMAVFDQNKDGYSDLVIGVPYEDVQGAADAGYVELFYGSAAGLNGGALAISYLQGSGTSGLGRGTPEAHDWLGESLAAGKTSDGDPYLIMGVPGEDIDGIRDAGGAYYIRDGAEIVLNEDTPGISGLLEEDDRFGYSVAASPSHIAIGDPGEGIGSETFSGGVQILSHNLNSDGIPTPIAGIDQDYPGVNGVAETGDRFGLALAAVSFRTSDSASPTESIIAIGAPGEDLTTGEDAGRVVTLKVSESGAVSQVADVHQALFGVEGVGESGDYFGQRVDAVNLEPDVVATSKTLLLAVGTPGEDADEIPDAGSIEVFPLVGPYKDGEVLVGPGSVGLPGAVKAKEFLGTSFHATTQGFFVGMPYGTGGEGSVYQIPWANLTGGTSASVTTWSPGAGGISTGGKAFGSVIR
jgi:FG-GAP repeat protein